METLDSKSVAGDQLLRKADLCHGALTVARGLAAAQSFDSMLSQALDRAHGPLDDMDVVLVALNPRRDHEAFVRAAALHRKLAEVQALLPKAFRRARPQA
jgi:hypothetical protein